MTKISKGHWNFDGVNDVELTMEFSKVDKENRLVSGFATLDNVDSQNDIVTPDASMKAFARARGNIREQHDEKKAVGKMVNFKEGEFYDKDTQTLYRGVYVTVRVSKGAQDTWEKVLDGTLSGFSIGGSINEATNNFDKSTDKTVRTIIDYDLTELSLVDNPANHLSNILSIKKSADGSVTLDGPATETKIETVYYCKEDGNVQPSSNESADCFQCGAEMEDIGWFEVVGDRLEKVRAIVDDFIKSGEPADEGGVDMSKKETFIKAVETDPIVEPVVPEPLEEVTPPVEVEPVVVEVEDAEVVIAKQIDDLKDAIHSTLENSKEETNAIVKSLEAKIEELNKSFITKTSEIDNKLDGFSERLDTAKSKLAEFEKSLAKMNSSAAFKKSADVVSEEKTEPKSKWDGAFSVDNLR